MTSIFRRRLCNNWRAKGATPRRSSKSGYRSWQYPRLCRLFGLPIFLHLLHFQWCFNRIDSISDNSWLQYACHWLFQAASAKKQVRKTRRSVKGTSSDIFSTNAETATIYQSHLKQSALIVEYSLQRSNMHLELWQDVQNVSSTKETFSTWQEEAAQGCHHIFTTDAGVHCKRNHWCERGLKKNAIDCNYVG